MTIEVAAEIICNCDLQLVAILFENLFSNAWKFTSKQPKAKIEFGSFLDADKKNPVFYVRDDGAGFESENAPNLFDAFQRFHNFGEFEGHGIGLATVKRVVDRHGGKIWAESKVSQGATFFFTLA